MSSVSASVCSTSWMAVLMYAVPSKAMRAWICSGISFCSVPISARTRSITSSAFALGSAQIPMKTAVWPLKLTAVS